MKLSKIIILIAIVLLASSDTVQQALAPLLDHHILSVYLKQGNTNTYLSLFGLSLLFVLLGGPRQMMAFAWGFALGPFFGCIAALSVSLSVASIHYTLSHFFFAQWLSQRFPKRVQQYRQFVQRRAFFKVLLLRLFPLGNNLVTNTLAGCVGVPFLAFISASALGYLPQTLIFELIGAGFSGVNKNLFYLSVLCIILSALITTYIYRDHKKWQLEKLKG